MLLLYLLGNMSDQPSACNYADWSSTATIFKIDTLSDRTIIKLEFKKTLLLDKFDHNFFALFPETR